MANSSEQWTAFLNRCLSRRVRAEQFADLAQQLQGRAPILGLKLADVLISRQAMIPGMLDPLILVYAETLLEHRRISSADLLGALYRHSKFAKIDGTEPPNPNREDADHQEANGIFNTAEIEATTFYMLTRAYLPGGGRPRTQSETMKMLNLLSEWLKANVTMGTALADESDPQILIDAMIMFESIGAMSIAMLENPKVIGVIDVMLPKSAREQLAQSLSSFISFWSTAAPQHAQSAARLHLARTNRGLVEDSIKHAEGAEADVAAAVQIDAVADLPITNTRPGAFIFISALLSGCPLTDESMMMNFLQVRYAGDAQSLAIDLIIASFDTLAAASERSETEDVMLVLKSFLVHKMPLLIATLVGSIPMLEFTIQQALSQVDINMFPTVGLGMLDGNHPMQDTRQDFVHACILHGLLTADSVARLLGEQTFDSPPSPQSRLYRNTLMQQCTTEPGRAVQLISQLEKLDGNAGAIVAALSEVIRTLCTAKDTMSLKSICSALACKPTHLDIILMFVSPATILQPICQLLDSWKYEDDQGESQPVYDEFASVFLLVLTFIHRFDLTHVELGVSGQSFVGQYIAQNHRETAEKDLTAEQSKHLESWVKGLFDPDGITEEVTASCQPQQFYTLVPTIFSQTLFACSAGVLAFDAMKSGLEYLSEPFLLPSLVDAIHWLTTYTREFPGADIDLVMQMLQRVSRAPPSGDAQLMHSTIMAITALPLVDCLRQLRKAYPKRSDIDPMLQALHQHTHFLRGAYSPCREAENWTSVGLEITVKSTVQSLITWSLQATSMNAAQLPPHYNHRLFHLSELVLGAPRLLDILLQEIKEQTENPAGAASVTLDIVTAIICAPKFNNSPIAVGWVASPVPAQYSQRYKRLNLREALTLAMERVTDVIKTDDVLAASIVRLHRRVTHQCSIGISPLPALQDMPPLPLDIGLVPQASGAGAAQAAPVLDFTQDELQDPDLADLGGGLGGELGDPMQIDLTEGDDMSIMGAAGTGLGGDDDVFGDLDLGAMGDLDVDYTF